MPLSEYTQRRVAGDMATLLQRAGVVGVVPTPLDIVGQAAGIEEVLDVGELPPKLLANKPSFLRRVVGALIYSDEIAFVDRSTTASRGRFIEAHEISHRALAWHRGSHQLRLDDEGRISRDTEEELEAEANHGAAHLLFQGVRFNEEALGYQISLRAPLLLAARWGTSIHAAIWHYVEYHPDPVALAVAGSITRANGTVPIWSVLESNKFRRRYGRFASWFPAAALSVGETSDVAPLGQIAHRARQGEDLPSIELRQLLDGSVAKFTAEAFYNQRSLFLMVRPKSRQMSLGRGIQLAAS